MKRISSSRHILLGFIAMLAAVGLRSQTPTDEIMMDKGQICIAALYFHETWDEYWEGTLKRDNGNIGTLTRQTVMPMFALGITEKINVLAGLPWVKTGASTGQLTGVSGLQDWGLWLKAEALNLEAGPGNFTFHAVAGLTGPASNYLPDYVPLNLGLGSIEGSLRGIVRYKLDKGPYIRGLAGFHVRGDSKIERDYYYTTHGVYSNKVDMPNAFTYGMTLGTWLLENSLRIEATFDGLQTLGGHDIRRQDVGFPSNKMIFSRIGGLVQYYLPFVKGLGVIATTNYILNGRNVGQSTIVSGGVTYFFNIWE